MPGVLIQVDSRLVEATLSSIAARAGDMRPAWDEVGVAMVDSTHERFRQQQGPDGTPWKPSQRALKDGGMTLTDTRRLDNSMTHLPDDVGVEWGTNVEYAAIHHGGGTITRHAHSAPIYRNLDDVLADREAFKSGEHKFGAAPFVKRAKATLETWHEVPEYQINMPARPYLGFNEADEAETVAILTDYLIPPEAR